MNREDLEDQYGQVWTTSEMQEKFTVLGFGYGVCVVKHKASGKKGTLDFQHAPRFYYDFIED